MPIYSYSCHNGHELEQVRKISERDQVRQCPECRDVLMRCEVELPAPSREHYSMKAIMSDGSTLKGHFRR